MAVNRQPGPPRRERAAPRVYLRGFRSKRQVGQKAGYKLRVRGVAGSMTDPREELRPTAPGRR
jgi:hypothetical protein